MIDVKIIKKPKNEGSTSAIKTSATTYGGMAVTEAAHAAQADLAKKADEATHASESDHAAEADHTLKADHAVNADEATHATEADHAKEADDADKWDGKQFADYLNQPVRTTDAVKHDSVETDSIRSAGEFVDGLLGSGFRLWKDTDGLTHLTLDKLTVRQTMSVLELLIEKVRSVGGQICVSAANGKVKSVAEQGDYWLLTFEQENTFVAGDLMRCQTFTGQDIRSYWVEVATAGESSVSVLKSEFGTVEPKEGDECVLMGNTTNKERQNVVLISATEDGQPRVDVMDGVKSKTLENTLRARLGNLDGIEDYQFPSDRQPEGNGLYADNAYLKGTFVLDTGEDVKTRFEISEGKVESAIASVRNDFLSEKGYLNNPTFASGLEKWNSENETVFFLVGNKWVWANNNVLSKKGDGASVVSDMGRTVVRIRNKYIAQTNANLRYVPTFATNADGKKEALPVYLSFFYRCVTAGTLKIHFTGVDKTGFADFESMAAEEAIAVTDGYVQYTCNGMWNGTGDFRLEFDGDIYLYMLVLSTDKVESLTYKYKTLFEQSESLVKIAAMNFDKDGNVLASSEIMTTADGNTLISAKFNDDGTLRNTSGLVTTAEGNALISAKFNDDGTLRDTSGLVTTADMSGLFAVDSDGNLKALVGTGQDGVKIKATNIELEGLVTANENFKILTDGSIEAANGKFTGEVNAEEGTIGGFTIGQNYIRASGNYTEGSVDQATSEFFLYSSGSGFIGFSDKNKWAGMGLSCTPAGVSDVLLRIENKTVDSLSTNYGAYIKVTGGATNIGLLMYGDLRANAASRHVLNGNVVLDMNDEVWVASDMAADGSFTKHYTGVSFEYNDYDLDSVRFTVKNGLIVGVTKE